MSGAELIPDPVSDAGTAGGPAPVIDAVVFDMDGVLIDSEVIWRRVREQFARELGRTWTEADQAACMGCSTPEWSQRMGERLGLLDRSPADLAADVIARVQAAFAQDLPVRPGAAQALEALAARWPLALASGSPRVLVDTAMALTGFGRHFRHVLSGDEVARGKPEPDLYLLALARLGVAGAAAVGIEDSANGLRALRAAGMRAVAAPCPEFPLPPEVLALAQAVIPDLHPLTPAWLQALPKG